MRIHVWALVLLAIAMPTLSACSVEPGSTAGASSSYTAVLLTKPARPAPMQVTVLELTLTDAQGRPVTGAAVTMELTMPSMSMPPNRPLVYELGNGVYASQALFTMAGEWEVHALVDQPGGSDSFTFRLQAK
jgi:hypothetical protein